MSIVLSAPRCTPPMPPVANTSMPASAATIMVEATVVAPSSPRAVYCFPPGTFWILVGCFAVTLHAVADAPLRSGAVLGLFFVALACADGYLPHQSEPRG